MLVQSRTAVRQLPFTKVVVACMQTRGSGRFCGGYSQAGKSDISRPVWVLMMLTLSTLHRK